MCIMVVIAVAVGVAIGVGVCVGAGAGAGAGDRSCVIHRTVYVQLLVVAGSNK